MTPREPEDNQRKYQESNRRRMTAPQQHYTISRAKLIELLKELPCQFEPTVMKSLTQTTVAAPTPIPQQPEQCPHALRENFTLCNSYEECEYRVFDSMTDDVFCKKGAQQPPAPAVLLEDKQVRELLDRLDAVSCYGKCDHESSECDYTCRKEINIVKEWEAALRERGEQHE